MKQEQLKKQNKKRVFTLFFSNNIIGGDSLNYSLYLFWRIGKVVFDNYKVSCNVIEKCSTFLSYYFGNSSKFNNDNIKYMIRFYSDFPVFYKELNKMEDKDER